MRIQNLKAPHESAAPATTATLVATPEVVSPAALANAAALAVGTSITDTGGQPAVDRQTAEIALLKARVQHLELVVETARALMGANQERLLRRLHELPRELVELTAQLRRIDPNAAC